VQIAALPEKCRVVYTMSCTQGKSNQQVVASLGISEKKVEA